MGEYQHTRSVRVARQLMLPARLGSWRKVLGTTRLAGIPLGVLLAAGGLAALVLGAVALLLHAQQALTGNLWGVPLDDAYIHFRFAQNLAGGHGFAFNPDQPIPASTSPLWVLLLAVPGLAGVPLWLAAKVYGVAGLVAAAILAWRLARPYVGTPLAAWAAGALTALDGRLLWAAPSGMEVTLFTALSLAAFLARPACAMPRAQAARRSVLVAMLCGLATLARPEGALLALVLAVDLYRRVRPPLRAVALAVALYLALVLPYAVFALATTGHPLPTTFYAKSSGLGPQTLSRAAGYIVVLAYEVVTSNVALLFGLLGAPALWRLSGAARAVVVWPLLLVVEQAVLSPALYQFGRYVMPLQPFFALWAVVGIGRLTLRALQARGWTVALPPLALAVLAALTVPGWANVYALSVQNIDGMQVALGGWVRAHVPAGTPVAMNDVGAITYISDHPAVDIVGLVTPRFIALEREAPPGRRARDIYAALKRRGARYLIIFPAVYPDLAREPGLRRVYSVTLTRPVIVPAATMAVYKISD